MPLVEELIVCPGGDHPHRRLCDFAPVAPCHPASARRSAHTENPAQSIEEGEQATEPILFPRQSKLGLPIAG